MRRLDPVSPGELDGAAETGEAAGMLARIVATDPDAEAAPARADRRFPLPEVEPPRRRRPLGLALGAATAVAVAVLVAVLALTGGAGSEGPPLPAVLDAAGARAATAPSAAGAKPFTYLKTREISVRTTDRSEER